MPFNYARIFLLGFGSFGFSLVWMVYNNFVPLLLESRFNLQPGLIGLFMTLDNIAALFIQPPIGALSDRIRTPIGRRMPFILVGVPVAATAFGILPLAAVLPVFVACTMSLLLSMALWRTPVVALMSDVTPSQYRSQANGITNFMGGIGAILGSLVGGSLFRMNQAYPFWMGSALVVFAAVMLLVFIREPKEYQASSEEEAPDLLKSLRSVLRDPDHSALRLLLAIFFWFIAYNTIEAFFTLYAKNRLGMEGGAGAQLLGQFSLFLVAFALPAGALGGKLGRRKVILAGIGVMTALFVLIFFSPVEMLTTKLFVLPVLGTVPVIGIMLMAAGAAWALINVNSLPMVVDMTDNLRVGTFTGLYYLFATLAAIIGPNLNGWVVQLFGNNYNLVMLNAPVCLVLALLMMLGVKKGEARTP